ncbi:MAG: hypothetical protein H0X66_20920 [Verrucomicrobia bacterium]|nr:hypothetical protein [Verrucomicrobiota bacterium]
MREKSNFGPMVIILICAVGLGLLVGWLAVRNPKSDVPPTLLVDAPPVVEPANNVITVATPDVKPVPPLTAAEEVNIHNWDDILNDILGSDEDEDVKADKLADMIPKLPEAAQIDIAEHLINLVSDENFTNKASGILLSETISGEVSRVLFDDLMNRGDDLRLPLTLEIAKNENHPLREEALESLEMTLVEEFGKDWKKWEAAIKESLQEQGFLDES